MEEQEHAERLHAVLKTLPHYTQSMKHTHWFPARVPRYAKEDTSLQAYFPPGIDHLYTHQIQVLSTLQSAQTVTMATPVASGKTYALALPARIAHAEVKHQRTTLLCLVSTKALARQWHRRLQAWDRTWRIETLTGDTKQEQKNASVQADVLIVTPEQLHARLLPHHYQWKAFLEALHSVILDDCQEYRGLFGSHVGLVLRRLQRVILSYREKLPHFLLASALIGNPKDHAEHLLGQSVEVIDAAQDGSAFAGCLHLLWQPPTSTRFADEAARLLALFIRQGYRVVVFAQARQAVERIVNRAREDLPKYLQGQVRPYRGGYDLSERVEMEEKLISGHLQGIVSTRALEVGLEMGVVDVVIIAGFPGSLISYFQQAGRAGRQVQSALCVFVPRPDALDTSFMAHPERLWQGTTEPLWLNTHNEKVLSAHLRCAAAELPLSVKDQNLFGSQMWPVIRMLVEEHHLIEQGDLYHAYHNIAGEIPLRQWGAEVIIELGDRTERTDRYYAAIECYPGAVYYSHGVSYSVTDLDQEHDRVSAKRCNLPYDTKPILETQVEILHEVQKMEDGPFQWVRGKVRVIQHVTGFVRQDRKSKIEVGEERFPQPYSYAFETNALWMTFADQFLKQADPKRVYPVLHAVEHGWLASCPLLIQGDRNEMNGVSVTPHHPDTKRASIFLYEESYGGNGYGERIYPHVRTLMTHTLSQLEACPCSNGCHRCIQKPYCHYFNTSLEKLGAMKLLRRLVQRFG